LRLPLVRTQHRVRGVISPRCNSGNGNCLTESERSHGLQRAAHSV